MIWLTPWLLDVPSVPVVVSCTTRPDRARPNRAHEGGSWAALAY